MIFDTPVSFAEALQARAVKTVLPTTAGSRLLATLPAEIRERATFSARVHNINVLDTIHGLLEEMQRSEEAGPGESVSRSHFRHQVREMLAATGYEPPEDKEGTLQDLSSDRRLNLIVDMGMSQARNYGRWKKGQDPDALDFFPCSELVRFGARKVPRDWPFIWKAAGGKLYQGRMIARKDDGIWLRISEFDLPYAPFKWGSGMNTVDVDRFDAEDLGVIGYDEQVKPQTRTFNELLVMEGPEKSEALLSAILQQVPGAQFIDGKLVLPDPQEGARA